MPAPLTDDPADGAEVVPDGAPAAVVAAGVAAVVPVVVAVATGVVGVVLEHPAIATATTTSMIAMILIREIFKIIPPDMM
jgi:hypothetical protein